VILAHVQSADRKAQESLPHFLDTKEERFALYPALNPLINQLADETDPYLVYLRGMMLMRLDQRDAAVGCFVQSVKARPYNWSCWGQLGQIVKSADMVSVNLVPHCSRTRPALSVNSRSACQQCSPRSALTPVHRAQGTPSGYAYAHIFRYHGDARPTHSYRSSNEYD
jgi:hypothetical protein